MTVLLDSGVCIELMRSGNAGAFLFAERARRGWESIAVSSVTRFELERGVAGRQGEAKARAAIDSFFKGKIGELPFDSTAAVAAARLGALARKTGKELGAYDVLIAGHAWALDAMLVTTDRRLAETLELVEMSSVQIWSPIRR
jgi:tRNA(fMet)-specific endonuclease VapC